jgi:hypothetical protein
MYKNITGRIGYFFTLHTPVEAVSNPSGRRNIIGKVAKRINTSTLGWFFRYKTAEKHRLIRRRIANLKYHFSHINWGYLVRKSFSGNFGWFLNSRRGNQIKRHKENTVLNVPNRVAISSLIPIYKPYKTCLLFKMGGLCLGLENAACAKRSPSSLH